MPADPGHIPSERAERYRTLADEADREAARRTGTLSEGYHQLAEKWRDLAAYVEENRDNELKVISRRML
jgi:hypothetical protein